VLSASPGRLNPLHQPSVHGTGTKEVETGNQHFLENLVVLLLGGSFFGSNLLGRSFLGSSLLGSSLRSSLLCRFLGSSLLGSRFLGSSLFGNSFLGSSLLCSYFLSSRFFDSSLRASSLLGSSLLDRVVSEFEGLHRTELCLDRVHSTTNPHGKTKSTVFRTRIHLDSQATKTLFWPIKTSAGKNVVLLQVQFWDLDVTRCP